MTSTGRVGYNTRAAIIGSPAHLAHSSSGLGRRPLKAEITGSNPVCATTRVHHTASGQASPGPICFSSRLLRAIDDNPDDNRPKVLTRMDDLFWAYISVFLLQAGRYDSCHRKAVRDDTTQVATSPLHLRQYRGEQHMRTATRCPSQLLPLSALHETLHKGRMRLLARFLVSGGCYKAQQWIR